MGKGEETEEGGESIQTVVQVLHVWKRGKAENWVGNTSDWNIILCKFLARVEDLGVFSNQNGLSVISCPANWGLNSIMHSTVRDLCYHNPLLVLQKCNSTFKFEQMFLHGSHGPLLMTEILKENQWHQRWSCYWYPSSTCSKFPSFSATTTLAC
jgi:hypothetical protein